ncbi:hypothetical protein K438DRAFT_1561811 [Mycena galopus ATCC 62051]|nr:hypothetical protein K438DRAFT_1561811 [Mycena galopus ATCC 62051]
MAARSINDIPTELLDLRQPDADICLQSNWRITVTQERLNGKLFYVLRPAGLAQDDCLIHILLSSAATTLQVLRLGWGPEPQDIIFHLIRHGVEFRCCARDYLRAEPRPPLGGGYTGLGFRPMGFNPTLLDFDAYQTVRREFLLSPRGRAALFAGGIIGRLARGDVPEPLAYQGPSSEVFTTDGRSSMAYWDGELTEDEIDLICGVYEIATGKKDVPQSTKVSWWPKPTAFNTSGLNIGWWSPDCERWFQHRLTVIKNGAPPRKQADWKHIIKFSPKSREVAYANERIAAEFLKARLL